MNPLLAQPATPPDLPAWQHALQCLRAGEPVTLLLVAASSGSSPGRQGFKMSVSAGELVGSVGGGIMEHKFVELARDRMRRGETAVLLRRQIHRAEAAQHRSGMICSGEQTLVVVPLQPRHQMAIETIVAALGQHRPASFSLDSSGTLRAETASAEAPGLHQTGTSWRYAETLGFRDRLTIVGGGHVALALSRLLATLDFHLTVLDDRPELNTLQQNPYAHDKRAVDYGRIREQIPAGPHQHVVVMTIGYRTDDAVVRQLLGQRYAYLGLLGSQAKIDQLLAGLRADGFSEDIISQLHTPIGLPIHSRTPAEIAVSIAAEIIRVRNAPAE